ncbi:MAG: GMC family oxidoreductase [Parvibaculaceae bacterium]
MPGEEFDFIVVGGGSAGCALAARLSESGRHRVALVEAGPRDLNPWIHLPIGYGKTMWDPRFNWKFETEPEPTMHGRRIYWPRGKVLGGSSSINGLIAIRGQREDYDRWRDLGNPGWGFSDVFPYFLKLESNPDLAGTQEHGASGPIAVTSIKARHELIEALIASAQANGIPRTNDFNGRIQEGVGYYQLTTRNGWRISAAQGYLRTARRRPNLVILTDAQAIGISFDGRRARAVAFVRKGRSETIRAQRGIVLSAGAIQTPHLLMLSGIGPREQLQRHGITPLVDAPEVGQNLKDHLQVRLIYKCTKPITTNDDLASFAGQVKIALQWLVKRSGPLAVGINQGGLFARALAGSATPDIQFHVATLSADMAGAKPHPFSGFTISVCQLRPESTGEIRLASADPLVRPLIHARYLTAPHDQACITAGIRLAQRIAATEPLASYVKECLKPGPEATGDAQLLEFARATGATIFHPTGTCRMGSDAAAVVDPRLRVNGVDGLWAADCSIMPDIVSGNTNLPAIMIGEKAADMMLEDTAALAAPGGARRAA